MMRPNRVAHRRVLVIDDNPAIHEDVRKILAPPAADAKELAESEAILFGDSADAAATTIPEVEFHIDSAFQGGDGIALVGRARKEHQPYALAFVDARMPPGLDGLETIARLWETDPDILIV